MSMYRFNTPPGWPFPPSGWTPPDGWQPDPSWPEAPPDWQWWVPDRRTNGPPVIPGRQRGREDPRPSIQEENEELRRQLAMLLGMDPVAVAGEVAVLRDRVQQLRREHAEAEAELLRLRAELVRTSVESGFRSYRV
ncbi:MAG: hypothetical protein ABW046_04390 [Actinoplanes sp.]